MNVYNKIETDINNIDMIEKWENKIIKIKEIKTEISTEIDKLNQYIDMISSNTLLQNNKDIKMKKKYNDIDLLLSKFNESIHVDDMIKYYMLICIYIDNIENELYNYESK